MIFRRHYKDYTYDEIKERIRSYFFKTPEPMPKKYEVGQHFYIDCLGYPNGLLMEVTKIADDGRILEARSTIDDPELAKRGFVQRPDGYYAIEWEWSQN